MSFYKDLKDTYFETKEKKCNDMVDYINNNLEKALKRGKLRAQIDIKLDEVEAANCAVDRITAQYSDTIKAYTSHNGWGCDNFVDIKYK